MLTEIGKNSIPSLLSTQPWTLRFNKDSITPPPPGLQDGDSLTFTGQMANLDTDALIGVITDEAGTSYPLNGQIDEQLAVTFFVTSGDSVYFFKGTAQQDVRGMSMEGLFTLVKMDDDMEDGNWSATATPPPVKDVGGRHHREHAPRGSR